MKIGLGIFSLVGLVSSLATVGCIVDSGAGGPAAGNNKNDNTNVASSADAIAYREIDSNPGCTTEGLTYQPASIPGYKCAAKAYIPPTEDTSKPIVILVHGNSSTPADYEKFPADSNMPQLSERLMAANYLAYAVDFRIDKTDDPKDNNDTQNAAHNFDHGWAVPILAHLIESVMNANPTRKINIVAFSVAPTVARDALRRLHNAGKKPFEHMHSLVWASGAHHGVSTFRKLCGPNPTMRGKIACELGDRTSYTQTAFHAPLNGPNGDFETPCLDGNMAFGKKDQCGGNKVFYTTIVMKDNDDGTLQDEFVSEGASALKGADNQTVALTSTDPTGYFLKGLFKNHYGAIRSEEGLGKVMAALQK